MENAINSVLNLMKKYLLFLIIIPLVTNCGAGSGGSGIDNSTGNKPTPACSSTSNVAKIKINEDGVYKVTYGVYKVTYEDLNNLCIDLSGADPAILKMTNQGKEIAIDVVDDNHNSRFDSGDYIEFYGNAIPRGDKSFRFTETNIYWLSAEGGAERKRIQLLNSLTPQLLNSQTSFKKVLHMEEDKWYEQKNYPEVTLPEDVREHWFWGGVFYTPGLAGSDTASYKRDYPFSIVYFNSSQPVSIKIRLQSVKGSHHIRGYINSTNNLVINEVWDSQTPFDIEAPIPLSYLNNNGQNTLWLESVGDTSSGILEIFYLDWFEVTYYHLYKVEHDELKFTGEGQLNLTNFSTSNMSIYDISDPVNVEKIIGAEVAGSPGSGYNARISVPNSTTAKVFLALSDALKKSPFAIEPYTMDGIKSKGPADYIIITHGDFLGSIESLATYRSSSTGGGYRVLTVNVKDVYDEFGDGIETPQAIKDFLIYAYNNWNPKPKFVLLVGDATVDYKDIMGYGTGYGVKSYVPAYLYNYTGLGEVPSDNWFADVNEDVLPEMNIGRIPAKTAAEVTAVVNKIISHESFSRSGNALLIADNEPIFEQLSDDLAGITPDTTKVYRGSDPDNFRTKVIDAINSGPLIVNYTGHGSVVDWANADVFSSRDVSELTNKDYPFVVTLNCLNGYFIMPDDGVQYPSVAEAFLLAQDKGAVAVFAASSIGYPSEHDPLAKSLYSTLYNANMDATLGEAVTKAKEDMYKNNEISEDVVETFIFFGDPATKLK